MYFSAGAEGRISYGHLGRTNLLLVVLFMYAVQYVHSFQAVQYNTHHKKKVSYRKQIAHQHTCHRIFFGQGRGVVNPVKLPSHLI